MPPKAFVIGNAAIDETIEVTALPAPGVSIHMREIGWSPGGKGLNQAVLLARSGIATRLLAVTGEDANGRRIRECLEHEGLDRDLRTLERVASDRSLVLVTACGENAILTSRLAVGRLDAAMIDELLDAATPGDLCVLQGNLTARASEAAFASARARDMVIAFNPSPWSPAMATLCARCDILFVNEAEAKALLGSACLEDADRWPIAGPGRVVVTRGKSGALLADADGIVAIPAEPVDARDPTGAGDTLMAVALARASGRGWLPERDDIRVASRAAVMCVGRMGTYTSLPSAAELGMLMSAP